MTKLIEKLYEYNIVSPKELEVAFFCLGETLTTAETILRWKTGFSTLAEWEEKQLNEWEGEDTLLPEEE